MRTNVLVGLMGCVFVGCVFSVPVDPNYKPFPEDLVLSDSRILLDGGGEVPDQKLGGESCPTLWALSFDINFICLPADGQIVVLNSGDCIQFNDEGCRQDPSKGGVWAPLGTLVTRSWHDKNVGLDLPQDRHTTNFYTKDGAPIGETKVVRTSVWTRAPFGATSWWAPAEPMLNAGYRVAGSYNGRIVLDLLCLDDGGWCRLEKQQ